MATAKRGQGEDFTPAERAECEAELAELQRQFDEILASDEDDQSNSQAKALLELYRNLRLLRTAAASQWRAYAKCKASAEQHPD